MNDNIEKRTVAIFCIVAAFVVALSFFAPDIFERVRTPVQSASEAVLRAFGSIEAGFADAGSMAAQIASLKEENNRLMVELQRAESYKSEVDRLRNVLELTWGKDDFKLVEGRLIAKKSGAFRRMFTISVPQAKEGQLVVNDIGLVGMVTDFSKGVAEGVLVTDPGFSIGVRSVRTGDAAVASGDFSLIEKEKLLLSDYDPGASFEEGDLLETMSEGLPVGIIDSEGNITPAAGLESHIYVVQYDEVS